MRKLALVLLAASSLLTGCVAYEPVPRHHDYGYRDRDRDGIPNRYDRDRDNDGVPDSRDRRPNDPRRY